jgi:hypothetical protein
MEMSGQFLLPSLTPNKFAYRKKCSLVLSCESQLCSTDASMINLYYLIKPNKPKYTSLDFRNLIVDSVDE